MDTTTTTTTTTETSSSNASLEALNAKLQDASEQAMTLVHRYAAVEPGEEESDDSATNNPWNSPQAMFQELNVARNSLNEAWSNYKTAFDKEQQAGDDKDANTAETQTPLQEEQFRVLYMDMITDAFGDVLNEMRVSEKDIDINILVDCLQSGIDFLDDTDKNSLQYFDSFREEEEEEEEDSEQIPVHQLRQLELGYPPVTAET